MSSYKKNSFDPKSYAKGAQKAEQMADERSLHRIANALDLIVEMLNQRKGARRPLMRKLRLSKPYKRTL